MHVVIIQYNYHAGCFDLKHFGKCRVQGESTNSNHTLWQSHSGQNVLHHILNSCYKRCFEMPLLFILDLVAAAKCLVLTQTGMCMKMDLQLMMGRQYSLGWQSQRIKRYRDVMAFRYGNPPSTILAGGIWKGIVWRRELATLVGE